MPPKTIDSTLPPESVIKKQLVAKCIEKLPFLSITPQSFAITQGKLGKDYLRITTKSMDELIALKAFINSALLHDKNMTAYNTVEDDRAKLRLKLNREQVAILLVLPVTTQTVVQRFIHPQRLQMQSEEIQYRKLKNA